MSDLYTTTRKLVALGCPEPEGLLWHRSVGSGNCDGWHFHTPRSHARATWEAHARKWAAERGVACLYFKDGWVIRRFAGADAEQDRTYRGPDLLAGIVEVLESRRAPPKPNTQNPTPNP